VGDATKTAEQQIRQYEPDPKLLDNRNVLVTGASRGLGRAISTACAQAGAQTILLSRNVKQLDELANEIVTNGGVEPCIVPTDLEGAGVDDYATIASLLNERFDGLDGVVLNAGMLGEMAPLASYDPISWARVFQVNVHSQFLLLQAMMPLLERRDDASIIFTSSGVARRARAYWGAYAASKFATEGMMQILADELAQAGRIRVNAINPGRLRTKMRAEAYPAEDPLTLKEPHEITNAYLFLLGRHGRGTHGMSLDAQAS
jgi:NAD(P)-dependent dehydrogenase (short-subunit alcohol dehydrogenase family)